MEVGREAAGRETAYRARVRSTTCEDSCARSGRDPIAPEAGSCSRRWPCWARSCSTCLIPQAIRRIVNNGILAGNFDKVIRGLAVHGRLRDRQHALRDRERVVRRHASARRSGTGLRVRLYRKITQLSWGNVDRLETSDLLVRLTTDINQVRVVTTSSVTTLLRAPLMIIGAILILLWIDVRLALVMLVFLPIVIGGARLLPANRRAALPGGARPLRRAQPGAAGEHGRRQGRPGVRPRRLRERPVREGEQRSAGRRDRGAARGGVPEPGAPVRDQPRPGRRALGGRRPRHRRDDRAGLGLRAPELPGRGDDPAHPPGRAAAADGLGGLVGAPRARRARGGAGRPGQAGRADARGGGRRRGEGPRRLRGRELLLPRRRREAEPEPGAQRRRLRRRAGPGGRVPRRDRLREVDARQPARPLLRRHRRAGDHRRRRRPRRHPGLAARDRDPGAPAAEPVQRDDRGEPPASARAGERRRPRRRHRRHAPPRPRRSSRTAPTATAARSSGAARTSPAGSASASRSRARSSAGRGS